MPLESISLTRLFICEAVELEGGLEHLFGKGADHSLWLLAGLEEGDGRDAGDTEVIGELRFGIDVDLGNLQGALVLSSDLVHDRGNPTTRRAPGGPKVNQDRDLGTQNLFFKCARRDDYRLRHRGISFDVSSLSEYMT